MVEATLFIGAVIAGLTQTVKTLLPERVHGFVTILVAVLAGLVVALVDQEIGVVDVTVAQGLMTAFGTVGVFTAVDRVGKQN